MNLNSSCIFTTVTFRFTAVSGRFSRFIELMIASILIGSVLLLYQICLTLEKSKLKSNSIKLIVTYLHIANTMSCGKNMSLGNQSSTTSSFIARSFRDI